MKSKTFAFHVIREGQPVEIQIQATTIDEAKRKLVQDGYVKEGENLPWVIHCTKRQIQKTKNMLRGL